VPGDVLSALTEHRTVRADVEVLKLSENRYRLVTVAEWRLPGKR
jgi:hypothetical protein